MSMHFDKCGLNTYYAMPYFQAHIPAGYPLSLVLQKCRAFRRLPPNIRKLSALAKQWAIRAYGHTLGDIDRWYDDDGYELNPDTGKRLTDEEIDAEWERWPAPNIQVEDIPIPPGGFADPDTWEEPEREPDLVDRSELTEAGVLRDIKSRGREAAAEEYGVPTEWLSRVKSDKQLACMIMDMHGKPWPAQQQ
jgi:hypothetical protein